MKIIPTWPIAAICLAVGVAAGAVSTRIVYVGKIDKLTAAHTEQLRQREVQRGNDERAAREKEQQLAQRAGQIEQEKTNEIARIRADYSAALAGVQNRPDRKPAHPGVVPSTSTACQGSTGAELSRPDAVFLNGEAARGDELRAALSACYAEFE